MRQLLKSHLLTPILTMGLLLIVLSCPDAASAQCAMCRETLKDSDNANLIRGFLYSILFMGSVPTLMMAGVGMLVLRSHRLSKGSADSTEMGIDEDEEALIEAAPPRFHDQETG